MTRTSHRAAASVNPDPKWPEGYISTPPVSLNTSLSVSPLDAARSPTSAEGYTTRPLESKTVVGLTAAPGSAEVPSRSARPEPPTGGWDSGPVFAKPSHGPTSKPAESPVSGVPGKSVNWCALEARVRECLRIEHYSYRTEQTYVAWIRRFVVYHHFRKPSTLKAGDVQEFLRHLAMDKQVASSTQNQALNAVVFLYRKVVKTTMIYTHVLNKGPLGVVSPVDTL